MASYRQTVLETLEVVPRKVSSPSDPLIIDDWTLAFFLGITGKSLWFAVTSRDQLYSVFTKPKASGGVRTLHNPNPFMRVLGAQIRRKILQPYVDKLGDHVTAYRRGRSTLDAAKRHLADCAVCAVADQEHVCTVEADDGGHVRTSGAENCAACQPVAVHPCPRRGVKIHLDLKDFFGSTRRSWIRNYFQEVHGYSHYVAGLLAQLLTVTLTDEKRTWSGVPQGGKASGDITNLIADWLLDQPLLKALPPEWTYSRYADDLYLSHPENVSRDEVHKVINLVKRTIHESGYQVNNKKTHVQRPHKQQKLLGVTLNHKLSIPRDEYRRMRALLHQCWHSGFTAAAVAVNQASGGALQGWLEGKIAYYKAVAPHKARRLDCAYKSALARHAPDPSTLFSFTEQESAEIPDGGNPGESAGVPF